MTALVKDTSNIRLGMIGMTPGNGHPFSWSAMFNRFNREKMKTECPFPAIPAYLYKEIYENIGIPGAHVTHVYCDRREDAELVQRLSLVPNVVDAPEAMLGQVDAVIIATDIGSQHVSRARPFIEAGLPLFIDKPLCDNLPDLEYFTRLFEAGYPLLSSSSFRYAKELMPYQHGHLREVGELRGIFMEMCKSWETYGIHALEAVYPLTGPGYLSVTDSGTAKRDIMHLKHRSGVDVVIASLYDAVYDPVISVYGTAGSLHLASADSYSSFRNQLVAFVDFLQSGVRPYPWQETVELIKLVSAGLESRRQGGKEILL